MANDRSGRNDLDAAFDAHVQPGIYFLSADERPGRRRPNCFDQLKHYRVSPHVTLSGAGQLPQKLERVQRAGLSARGRFRAERRDLIFRWLRQSPSFLATPGMWAPLTNSPQTEWSEVSGTFTNLHYPNPAQVPGLYDSSSQGASAFSSLRVSKMHYFGVNYQYQRLLAYPTEGLNETQTHAVLFFYTLYATPTLSVSFFGGPQHSDTVQPPLPPLNIQLPAARAWTPAAGTSLSWQGRLNSVAVSYKHIISGGGGLFGAVHLDSASASIQQQIARSLSGSVAASYTQNNVLGSPLFGGATDGHTVTGTASLQKQFGEHINVQLGYTRLHQNYSNVAVLSTNPDTNRGFVSVSYQFSRPLGR